MPVRPLQALWHFTRKEVQASLFTGLFFLAVFLVPRGGQLGLPRHDLLLGRRAVQAHQGAHPRAGRPGAGLAPDRARLNRRLSAAGPARPQARRRTTA